jgi:hypothetical protein
MRKQRLRRISVDAYDRVQEMADKRIGPAEIQRRLRQEDIHLSLPTIRDIWRERNPAYESQPWSVMDGSGDDARILLAILQQVFRWSEGRIHSFTRREAEAVLAVHRAAPTINDALKVWAFATEYIRRQEADAEVWDLDLMLAYRIGEASSYLTDPLWAEYKEAVRAGTLPGKSLRDVLKHIGWQEGDDGSQA